MLTTDNGHLEMVTLIDVYGHFNPIRDQSVEITTHSAVVPSTVFTTILRDVMHKL